MLPDTEDSVLIEDFEKSKLILSEHGCNPNILVFPKNASDSRSLETVRKYFTASFKGSNIVNVSPVDRYQISRVNLLKDQNPLSLSAMKSWVDSAIDKGGVACFYGTQLL